MLMSKIEMAEAIMEAKFAKKTTWADISKAVGMSEVFVASACLCQNTLPAEAAAKLIGYLNLGNPAKDVDIAIQRPPKKGPGDGYRPKDPLIYRIHEITYVYGDAIKEMIH